MNEQQKAIAQAVENIKKSVVDLTQQKTEIEFLIEGLRRTEALLTKQLPIDDRINRLFQ